MASGHNLTISRYTDLRDEPVTHLLSPIKGYQDTPLVSLEEATGPIAAFFDGLDENVWVAKENCKNPADGLTQDESASIHLYTMQFDSEPYFYQLFNMTLRAENRQDLKPWFAFLKLFLTALYKLPSCAQTVWRGVRGVDLSSKYPNGSKFAWWGVSSCTINMDVLSNDTFLGKKGIRTLFSIECQNGKSIGSHSYFKTTEKEVILMPGSYFEVIGQLNPAEGLHIIHLKEIQPPFALVKPPFVKLSTLPTTTISSESTKVQKQHSNASASGKSTATVVNTPKSQNQIKAASSYTPPPPPSAQKKVQSCGGNACATCGKCRDWRYDGNIKRDHDRFLRDESDDILDDNRWHRSADATCSGGLHGGLGYGGGLHYYSVLGLLGYVGYLGYLGVLYSRRLYYVGGGRRCVCADNNKN